MGELLGKIAIARQKKQTLGLGVEPADIKKTGEFCRQQIIYRVSCVRVAASGNETRRFMERDGQCFGRPNEPMPNFDMIARFNLRAEIGTRLTVNGNAAFRDQLIAMPARAKPGGGEEAIQAHGRSLKGLRSYNVKRGPVRHRFNFVTILTNHAAA
jgi:hypothetical protein